MPHKVRVWDLPTRLFHWALVLLVVAQVATAMIGGNAMIWHLRFGYGVLALLVFRLIWGFVGGRWSRFASFLYAPRTMLSHLRGHAREEHQVGHSPLGAGSVFAMLLLIAAQVATGLFSDDEIFASGPFARFVSNDAASSATAWHTGWGGYLLLALIALHIGVVLSYVWRRKNHDLISAMIGGDKQLARPAAVSRDDAPQRLVALVLFVACMGGVGWLVSLGR